MNEENGFNVLLDQDNTDDNARLIFADWLGDHDDPRAEGYRQLGKLQRRCISQSVSDRCQYQGVAFRSKKYNNTESDKCPCSILPDSWLYFINSEFPTYEEFGLYWFSSRQTAEDAAAIAYNQITKILNTTFHAIEVRTYDVLFLTRFQIVQIKPDSFRWKALNRIKSLDLNKLGGNIGVRTVENLMREYPNFLATMKKGYDECNTPCNKIADIVNIHHQIVTKTQFKIIAQFLNLKG